jgi:hypothetical protein
MMLLMHKIWENKQSVLQPDTAKMHKLKRNVASRRFSLAWWPPVDPIELGVICFFVGGVHHTRKETA